MSNKDCIRPYEKNPCYWQYRGKPILLLGASSPDHLFQWAYIYADLLRDRLDYLVSIGGNYVRNNTNDDNQWKGPPRSEDPALDPGKAKPFKKLETGLYDLAQWDEGFFEALDLFLRETREREIIVNQELWDYCNYLSARWPYQPWNPKNNVNYREDETGLAAEAKYRPTLVDGQYLRYHIPFFHCVPTMNDEKTIYALQERYMRRFLSVTLQYDHVIYQVDNESTFHWKVDEWWIQFLAEEAAKHGRKLGEDVYIGAQRYWYDLRHREYDHLIERDDLYAYISPANVATGPGDYVRLQELRHRLLKKGKRPLNFQKLYPMWGIWPQKYLSANDVEAEPWWGPHRGNQRRRLWKFIFGGASGARYHREYLHRKQDPQARWIGIHPGTVTALTGMRMFADYINRDGARFFKLEPAAWLLSDNAYAPFGTGDYDNLNGDYTFCVRDAYAMAELGEQYAVYFSGEGPGSVRLDLSAAQGALRARWLDIGVAKWGHEGALEGGGTVELTRPGPGEWAVYMERIGGKSTVDLSYSAGAYPIVGVFSGKVDNQQGHLAHHAFDGSAETYFKTDGEDVENSEERYSRGKFPWLRQAHIVLDLGRAKTVNEVKLKMWRAESVRYPIAVHVDDERVWEGETAKASGPESLSFDTAEGRFVRIEMTGPNTADEQFGIVHVAVLGPGGEG